MRRTQLVFRILVSGMLLTGALTSVGAEDLSSVGPVLQNHTMENLSGETVGLDQFLGEVVVVNFWASWCPPCLRELPELDTWHAEWSATGARVVAISIDNKVQNARSYVDQAKLNLTVWHDGPQGLARQLNLSAVPTSFVVNRKGEVVLRIVGSSDADLERMHRTVLDLLAKETKEGPRA